MISRSFLMERGREGGREGEGREGKRARGREVGREREQGGSREGRSGEERRKEVDKVFERKGLGLGYRG